MHALQEQYALDTEANSETISRFTLAIFASSIFAAAGTPLSAPVFFSLFLAPIVTALVFLWAPGAAMGIVSMLASSATAAIAAILVAVYIVFAGEIKGAPSIALASFPLAVAALAVVAVSTQPWRVKRRGVLRSYPGLVPGHRCRITRCRYRDAARVLENQKNDRKAECQMQEINGMSDERRFRQSAFFASASIYPFVMMLVLDSHPHPVGVWVPLIGAALSIMAGAARTRSLLALVPVALATSSVFAVGEFSAAVAEADFSDPMVLVPFAASLVAWPLIALVISSLATRAGLHNVTLTPGAVVGFAAVAVVFVLLSILRFVGISFTLAGEPVLFF